MEDKKYGVLTEQGFVDGQYGFTEAANQDDDDCNTGSEVED